MAREARAIPSLREWEEEAKGVRYRVPDYGLQI